MAVVNSKSAPESIKHRVLLDNNDTEGQENPYIFTFVTFNVLADCHAQRDYASIYDPQYVSANFRHSQIMKELEYLDGDIVCLQEVSPDFYHEYLKNWYTNREFKSHYLKRNGSYDEGCATFYRADKFICQTVELINMSQVTEELFQLVAINNETKTKAAKRYCMNDVAILTQLRWKETGHVVTVVNTHVYFGEFKKPDLQVLQVSCLKWILNQKFGGSPAILCGDFNMSPDSPQYIFTTEGTLSEKQWDLLREIAKIEEDLIEVLKLVVRQPDDKLQYRSMYKHVKEVIHVHYYAIHAQTMVPQCRQRVHVICGPEPPKAKGPRVLASTNRRLFDLLQ